MDLNVSSSTSPLGHSCSREEEKGDIHVRIIIQLYIKHSNNSKAIRLVSAEGAARRTFLKPRYRD